MTIEAMVALPALIAVAVIAVNALLFFDACASFDRQFRLAVTTFATSPAHGEGQGAAMGRVEQSLEQAIDEEYLDTEVSVSGHSPGWITYTGELRFTPTLFGHGFSGSAFGVSLPPIVHRAELTIDPYKPGAIV